MKNILLIVAAVALCGLQVRIADAQGMPGGGMGGGGMGGRGQVPPGAGGMPDEPPTQIGRETGCRGEEGAQSGQ